MRLASRCILSVALMSLAAPLQAAPSLFYNSFSGSLYIVNDFPGSIINIKSPSGRLNAPAPGSQPLPSPALLDTGDLPNFLAILNTPEGYYGLGGVVDVGTPAVELSFDWYESFGQPAKSGSIYETPEPATASLLALGAIAFAGASRRLRRGIATK